MSVHQQILSNGVSQKIRSYSCPVTPLVETLTNGFFVVDSKWKVIYWNKAAEEILNVKQSEVMGKNLWERFANLLPVEFYAVYEKAFINDIPVHFHEYWCELDAWFEAITWFSDNTLSVSFKSSKNPREKNFEYPEKRLKTLTELYKFVTEITNDCLWEWDLTTHEIFWIDGGHKRVFGYPIENTLVPQRFWENCIHPDDKARVLQGLKNILAAGKESAWEDEYRFKKADGSYIYVHDRGHIVYDENQKATRIIGATQNINERILQQEELSAQKLVAQKEVTSAVLMGQEFERIQIGKELHDNLGQILAVAKMYLETAKRAPAMEKSCVDKPISLITEVIDEIRKISKKLVIPARNIMGLFDNINNLVKDITLAHPIEINFITENIIEEDLDDVLQVTIFRIIQEQLNNVLKHSEASVADITLKGNASEIELTVADDGLGEKKSTAATGVGIINIKSRAALYNGSVTISSKPGSGYTLKVVLPYLKK